MLNLLLLFIGAILPLAFAPFHFFFLAPLCLAGLLFFLLRSTPKTAFYQGLLFGLGFFGVGASWIYISIDQFGGAGIFLSGLITILFVAALALFIAAQTYFFVKVFVGKNSKQGAFSILFGFPTSWVLCEILRGFLFTGFPWLLIGASQTNSPLRGFFPIVGEYGVSFLVTFTAAMIVFLIKQVGRVSKADRKTQDVFSDRRDAVSSALTSSNLFKRTNIMMMVLLPSLWIGGYFLSKITWTQPQGTPITVSLIQGNIPQQMKWSKDYLNATLDHYISLTAQNWRSRLIIWPEAAVPDLFQNQIPFFQKLNQQAKENNTTLLIGVPTQEGFYYYNSAILLGKDSGIYNKRHLVPFGEYTPLQNWFGTLLSFLNIPMSDFKEGAENQTLLKIGNIPFAVFVCYEMAYVTLVLKDLPQAQFLVTISDDAWFGHSFAASQHLQIGQVRAMEMGRYQMFVGNTGLTAVMNPAGKIEKILPPFQTAVLNATIQPMQGSTPFVNMINFLTSYKTQQ